jgi:CRISPR/Cas system-associated exonuclease Cas4 (RecB family)
MDKPSTSISEANSCLAAVGFKKIMGLTEEQSPEQVDGMKFHSAIEGFWKTGETRAINPRIDKWVAAYLALPDVAEIQAAKKAVELKTTKDFDGLTINARTDLAYQHEGQTIVVDYKTRSKKALSYGGETISSQEKFQLATEAWMLNLPLPAKGEIHIVVKDKDEPFAYILEGWIDESDIAIVKARFEELRRAYETKVFRPEPSFKCRNCSFIEQCQEGRAFNGDFNPPKNSPPQKGQDMVVLNSSKDFATQKRYLKLLLVGETGTLKTRTALAFPKPVVIDIEGGTQFYQEEFDFKWSKTQDLKAIDQIFTMMAQNPEFDTLVIDPFTLYCDAVRTYFMNLFLVHETGKTNKGEYFRMDAKDYAPIADYIEPRLRFLTQLNCHVVLTTHDKDEYIGREKSGRKVPDAQKHVERYMDVVIYLTQHLDANNQTVVVGQVKKDRTHRLPSRIENFCFDTLKGYWADYLGLTAGKSVMEVGVDGQAVAVPTVAPIAAPVSAQTNGAPVPAAPVAEMATASSPRIHVETPGSQDASPATRGKIQTKFQKMGGSPEVADDWMASWIARQNGNGFTQTRLLAAATGLAAKDIALFALGDLKGALNIDQPIWEQILKNRSVTKASELSEAAIYELLGKLEGGMNQDELSAHVARWPFRAKSTPPANS